ncbi:Hypothetical protein BFF97_00679 [Corynebacterium pseudotuberculosis]|nr:Hypothetical protein BFF97_00679 [Corynebacterium pseudotuberculosis]
MTPLPCVSHRHGSTMTAVNLHSTIVAVENRYHRLKTFKISQNLEFKAPRDIRNLEYFPPL